MDALHFYGAAENVKETNHRSKRRGSVGMDPEKNLTSYNNHSKKETYWQTKLSRRGTEHIRIKYVINNSF